MAESRPSILLSIALMTATVLSMAPSAVAQPILEDGWPMRHRDSARSGRTIAAGAIQTPSVAWSVNTGGRANARALMIADANGDGQDDVLAVVGGAIVARRLDQTLLWDTPSLGLSSLIAVADLNGDGRAEVLALGTVAVLLDGGTGEELWRFENPDGVRLGSASALLTNTDDDPEPELLVVVTRPSLMALFDFSEGFQTAPRWQLEDPALPTQVFRVIEGRFDARRQGTLVATINQLNCQAVFTDPRTGDIVRISDGLTEGLFCYGLLQAADVDSDGDDELVFSGALGNGRGSVGVGVYDFESDALLWRHEYAVGDPLTLSRAPVGAVADLDGNGRAELVISVFNNTEEVTGGDGFEAPGVWSMLVYDAATGELLDNTGDRIVMGLADVMGNARPEIIARSAVGGSVREPSFGAVRIYTFGAGRLVLQHELDDAQVLTFEPTSNRVASTGNTVGPAIFDPAGQRRLMVLSRSEGSLALQLVVLNGNRPQVTAEIPVLDGVEVSLVARLGGRAALKTTLGQLEIRGDDLGLEAALTFTGHSAPALSAPLGGAQAVLYRDSTGALTAIDPAGASLTEAPEVLWRRAAGRGIVESAGLDLDGDKQFETVFSGIEGDGTPFVEMIDAQGQPRWRRAFPQALLAPFSLTPAQLGGDGLLDVAALVLRLDGTAATVALDGRSGELLSEWVSDVSEVRQFPNRELLVLGDLDNDGLSELALLHYTSMERLRGRDLARIGDVLLFPPGAIRPANSALIASDDGPDALFLNLFTPEKTLVDLGQNAPRWSAPSEPSHSAVQVGFAGLADANGDGVVDIAVPGTLGDLTVFDGASGAVLRRLCLAGGAVAEIAEPATQETCAATTTLSSVAVADIDDDGAEDYIVGTSDGWLHAVTAANGEPVWALFLRKAVSDPILSDVDADGAIEVVVSVADSRLVAVDNARIQPVAEVRDVLLDTEGRVVAPEVDIDVSSRTDALAVSWTPAEGADGYLVAVLSENLNEVTPPIEVRGTEAVFGGLSLVAGTRYTARVIPFADAAGSAAPTFSDGVLITGDGPTITAFEITPDPFDPFKDGSATITALLSSVSGIDRVTLTVAPAEQPEAIVFEQRFEPNGVQSFDLSTRWDGRGGDGFLPDGVYVALLTAFDNDGAGVADTETVTIAVGQPIELDPRDPSTTLFKHKPGCGCTVPAGDPGVPWWPLALLVGVFLIRAHRTDG